MDNVKSVKSLNHISIIIMNNKRDKPRPDHKTETIGPDQIPPKLIFLNTQSINKYVSNFRSDLSADTCFPMSGQ